MLFPAPPERPSAYWRELRHGMDPNGINWIIKKDILRLALKLNLTPKTSDPSRRCGTVGILIRHRPPDYDERRVPQSVKSLYQTACGSTSCTTRRLDGGSGVYAGIFAG
ncbi:hypothetical protein EYR41_010561 [Orbilia oligospora]|uniref:Uncharacterized protein n=1 Tax=Orbilia oligospora TaxID=2813651 RepID=A0A8H2DT92_ORBOL|nr:hypothetical protein EYR41_010561 [Orbilia oligospora]